MDTQPLVSVCIPTYCGAAYIGEAINSVLSQTLGDFELVVVDDNSSDGTVSVVEAIADRHIRLLRNSTNLGPEGNWNRCLAEARGKYFKLLPHDDLLHPDCLRQQVAVLEDDTAEMVALVFGARTIVGPDGRAQLRRGYPRHHAGRIPSAEITRKCLRRGTNVIGEPGSVLMRLSLARQVGPFNARFPYITDLEYWLRLLQHGDGWYIDAALSSFRVSGTQWSFAIGRRQSTDFSRFVSHIAALPQHDVGKFDMVAAHAMARLNNLLRLCYYRMVVRH